MARILTKPGLGGRGRGGMDLTEGTKECFEQSQGSLPRASAEYTDDKCRGERRKLDRGQAGGCTGPKSQASGACEASPMGETARTSFCM